MRVRACMRMYVRAPGGYMGAMRGLGLVHSLFLFMFVLFVVCVAWCVMRQRSGKNMSINFVL